MINKAPNEVATAADPSTVVQLSPNSVSAPVVLADATPNPTAVGLAGFLMAWNIVGSVNTAMTLEFTAAGVAGSFESVSMTGYDAS